jgi:hypothetical protein
LQKNVIPNGKKVAPNFEFTSTNNPKQLTVKEINNLLTEI